MARDTNNSIKNGKYGVEETARLNAYQHPNYGWPDLRRRPIVDKPADLKNKIDNEEMGNWRRGVQDDEDY